MTRRTMRLGSATPLAVLLLGGALWPSPAVVQTTVVATDLGTLGGTHSSARAVNATGQVVGYSYMPGNAALHAFSWTQAGGMVDLGTLGGTQSFANGVSANGQVVGYSYTAGNAAIHAFSWTQAGGMVDLGTLGGTESNAKAVNATGQVVGWARTGTGAQHAFSWTQAGGMVDLGTFVGGLQSYASAVNDNGQVVGQAYLAGNAALHAFSWTQAGGMRDLGAFGGYYSKSWASGVNATGQVVGHSEKPGGKYYAFSWTQGGGMVDLGTLGGRDSLAVAVNATGQVVGYADTAGNAGLYAFLWTQAGGMVDLGTLGGTYSYAAAVNDNGQVVGGARTGTGATHAVLWTLVSDTRRHRSLRRLSPGLGNNGDVTVTFTCSDPVSGLAEPCPSSESVTAEGAGQSRSGTVADLAGNSASLIVSGIHIDTTPPVITGARSPAANAAGWNNTDVTVTFSCSDALSGVPEGACGPSPQTVTSEGVGQSRMGTVADLAGNTASTSVGNIHIDKTPPALNLPASFEVDASSPTGAMVTYVASATDLVNGSVAVSCTPASGAFFAVGVTTVTCTGTDGSGNSATGGFTVTVLSASSQIANTIEDILAGVYGTAGSFASTLESPSTALENGNVNAACGSLGAFENQVEAKIGKSLTAAQGTALIAAANQMHAASGCN